MVVVVARFPTTPFITNTFKPMGGVIIPISKNLVRTTPNHSFSQGIVKLDTMGNQNLFP